MGRRAEANANLLIAKSRSSNAEPYGYRAARKASTAEHLRALLSPLLANDK